MQQVVEEVRVGSQEQAALDPRTDPQASCIIYQTVSFGSRKTYIVMELNTLRD